MLSEFVTVFLVFLVLIVLIGLAIGLYVWNVQHDLARRWERLRGLAANVRAIRQRRQGVGHDVGAIYPMRSGTSNA